MSSSDLAIFSGLWKGSIHVFVSKCSDSTFRPVPRLSRHPYIFISSAGFFFVLCQVTHISWSVVSNTPYLSLHPYDHDITFSLFHHQECLQSGRQRGETSVCLKEHSCERCGRSKIVDSRGSLSRIS